MKVLEVEEALSVGAPVARKAIGKIVLRVERERRISVGQVVDIIVREDPFLGLEGGEEFLNVDLDQPRRGIAVTCVVAVRDVEHIIHDMHLGGDAERALGRPEKAAVDRLTAV